MLDNPISLINDSTVSSPPNILNILAPTVISKYIMHDDSALNERDEVIKTLEPVKEIGKRTPTLSNKLSF